MGDKVVLLWVGAVIAVLVSFSMGRSEADKEWRRVIRGLSPACHKEFSRIVDDVNAADEATHGRHER